MLKIPLGNVKIFFCLLTAFTSGDGGYYGNLCIAYDEMAKYFIDKTTPLYKETVLLLDGKSVVSSNYSETQRGLFYWNISHSFIYFILFLSS